MPLPKNVKKIEINEDVSEQDLRGCYLQHSTRDCGGKFNYGSHRGFSIDGCWYSSETGDSLYDHITINNFKVYRILDEELNKDNTDYQMVIREI